MIEKYTIQVGSGVVDLGIAAIAARFSRVNVPYLLAVPLKAYTTMFKEVCVWYDLIVVMP
jgi:hypothetical protein